MNRGTRNPEGKSLCHAGEVAQTPWGILFCRSHAAQVLHAEVKTVKSEHQIRYRVIGVPPTLEEIAICSCGWLAGGSSIKLNIATCHHLAQFPDVSAVPAPTK